MPIKCHIVLPLGDAHKLATPESYAVPGGGVPPYVQEWLAFCNKVMTCTLPENWHLPVGGMPRLFQDNDPKTAGQVGWLVINPEFAIALQRQLRTSLKMSRPERPTGVLWTGLAHIDYRSFNTPVPLAGFVPFGWLNGWYLVTCDFGTLIPDKGVAVAYLGDVGDFLKVQAAITDFGATL